VGTLPGALICLSEGVRGRSDREPFSLEKHAQAVGVYRKGEGECNDLEWGIYEIDMTQQLWAAELSFRRLCVGPSKKSKTHSEDKGEGKEQDLRSGALRNRRKTEGTAAAKSATGTAST